MKISTEVPPGFRLPGTKMLGRRVEYLIHHTTAQALGLCHFDTTIEHYSSTTLFTHLYAGLTTDYGHGFSISDGSWCGTKGTSKLLYIMLLRILDPEGHTCTPSSFVNPRVASTSFAYTAQK